MQVVTLLAEAQGKSSLEKSKLSLGPQFIHR